MCAVRGLGLHTPVLVLGHHAAEIQAHLAHCLQPTPAHRPRRSDPQRCEQRHRREPAAAKGRGAGDPVAHAGHGQHALLRHPHRKASGVERPLCRLLAILRLRSTPLGPVNTNRAGRRRPARSKRMPGTSRPASRSERKCDGSPSDGGTGARPRCGACTSLGRTPTDRFAAR